MCDSHPPSPLTPLIDEAREDFERSLSNLLVLEGLIPRMTVRDKAFAGDLIASFTRDVSLSSRQWEWVNHLVTRYTTSEPIYGSFAPILVMFRLAQSHGLKRPRIRLITSEPDNSYFELWFKPGTAEEKTVEIMLGGWQGHGRRRFGGWIANDHILPWADRLSPAVRSTIQDLSLDPLGVAKAMAARLSACMYCGTRLSDDESKTRGYGPICANHYGLPWGTRTEESISRANAAFAELDAILSL